MSLEEKQAAALRQRRRAFLDEVATIKKRQQPTGAGVPWPGCSCSATRTPSS